MAIEEGAVAELSWALPPGAGQVSLELVRPDGLTSHPEVTVTTGLATALFAASMPGRWLLRWSQEDGATSTDVADVWPKDPRFLISLDEAKNAIGASSSGVRGVPAFPLAQEADLRLYIAAATPVIEDITGPILLSTETLTAPGGVTALVLPHHPVIVTSVTSGGDPVAFETDPGAGILWGGTRQAPTTLPPGPIRVEYTIGTGTIPANLILAARELLRHWWQVGKNALRGGADLEQTGDAFTPSGFAVPRRVIELCTPHEQIGGFA